MPQSVKFIAFLTCVLSVATLFKPGWMIFAGSTGPIHVVNRKVVTTTDDRVRPIAFVLIRVATFAGSIVLLIDACRRQYDEPKALPLILAAMGVLTLGMTSVIYYLEWGCEPTKSNHPVAESFCPICVSGTRAERLLRVRATHHILTFRLIGSLRRCPDCGSIVKTLWIWLFIPLLPIRAYRVLPNSQASIGLVTLRTRRLPWLDWKQVVIRYIMLALIAAGMTLIVWL